MYETLIRWKTFKRPAHHDERRVSGRVMRESQDTHVSKDENLWVS